MTSGMSIFVQSLLTETTQYGDRVVCHDVLVRCDTIRSRIRSREHACALGDMLDGNDAALDCDLRPGYEARSAAAVRILVRLLDFDHAWSVTKEEARKLTSTCAHNRVRDFSGHWNRWCISC